MKRTKQTQASILRIGAKASRALLLTFLAQLTALVFAVVPALGFETHLPLAFSPITGAGTGVSLNGLDSDGPVVVDEATGNVFLYDTRDNITTEKLSAVDVFDAEGGIPSGVASPYRITGLTSEVPSSKLRDGLAFDNSAGSLSKGTLYVAQEGGKNQASSVTRFVRNSSTEKYESAGKLTAIPAFVRPGGLSVDQAGNLFVIENNNSGVGSVFKFTPAGTQVSPTGSGKLPLPTAPLNVGAAPNEAYIPRASAVDSAGDLFILGTRVGGQNGPGTKIIKFSADGSGNLSESNFTVIYAGDTGPNGVQAKDIEVDTSTNALYIAVDDTITANTARVNQYDATTLVRQGELGAGTLTSASNVGVNSSTGLIYVSDRTPSNTHIDVFGPPVKLATLDVDEPTGVIASRATFHATVNPENVPISECKFEYGTTTAYGSVVPCDLPLPPTDEDDHQVTASVDDLIPNGVTYHVRVTAGSPPSLLNSSPDRTFLSGAPAVTEPATGITGAKATLNATVLPLSLAITECKFEYGPTAAYGKSAPCAESVPADDDPHAVSAEIGNLLANGGSYHFRIVTNGGAGLVQGNDEVLVTKDTFLTGGAGPIADTTATLSATVNLEGVPLTDCKFEYGLAALSGYEDSVPCQPLFSAIPADSTVHPVTGALSGLIPGVVYRYRVVAENTALVAPAATPTIHGGNQTFKTFGKPLISGQTASAVSASGASLEGQINPNGAATTYHFEWGLDSAYGNRTPAEAELSAGSGSSFVGASAIISGLQEHTTYHFRIVAENQFGPSEGADQVFITAAKDASCVNSAIRATQGASVLALPDCMALEMVSPAQKEQQGALGPSVSINGNRVLFNSIATLGNSPSRLSAFGDDYVATRSPSGWVTASTTPPALFSFGNVFAQSYTPDFTGWFHVGGTAEQTALGVSRVFQDGLGQAFSPVSPQMSVLDGKAEPSLAGASADHSRVYVNTGSSYLPGDPQLSGTGKDQNVYVAGLDGSGQPSVALFGRDLNGKAWGANCGVRVGGQGAISTDGGRVYFSTRPDQPDGGSCNITNQRRIMVRQETTDGPEIDELIDSECTRVSPPCSPSGGDDFFQGASIDQTRVYFTTNRQLADTDLDGSTTSCGATAVAGCDLYLYDSTLPPGERLIQVTAGDGTDPHPGEGADVTNSVTEISGDGSHVYFVARSVLTTGPNPQGEIAQDDANNLYAFEYPQKELAFIGTLKSSEGGSANAYSVPVLGTDGDGAEIGGDGHTLVFGSAAALTADDVHPAGDLFRYDADSTTLELVSKAVPGGSNGGTFTPITTVATKSTTDFAVRGRWVSEDGNTIVFTTKEALLPDDTNGVEDSYMWRRGQMFRLPGSLKTGGPEISTLNPTISPDGDTAAYTSDQRLLSFDGDTVNDIYVARVDGGYLPPPGRPICNDEECQGAPKIVSADIGDVSSSFTGPGNVKESLKCPKGKVRKHGKCVKKKKSKKAHHKKSHRQSAASHNGGGRK